MRELNIRNLALMTLIFSCFMQIGGQLFAVSVLVSTITDAPPRSFAILEGEYPYDSSGFWSTLPPITAFLYVVALIANWKTQRRMLLLVSLGLFIFGGLIAGLVLEPGFAKMVGTGYSDTVDPELQSQAAQWYYLDWAAWGVGVLAGLALLLALALPAERNDSPRPNGTSE
jgi:hypothetical protein